MLGKVLRDILASRRDAQKPESNRRRVLNVGGGSKTTPIPVHYNEWDHVLLDVDPRGKPDIVCDARNPQSLQPSQFDAVYCSHNLEHYYRHDGAKVLHGFQHVLKPDGFVEIRVPDLQSVIQRVVESKMDLGDVLYVSPSGPIMALDVLYGCEKEIEASGRDFYAHKTGFTPKLLHDTLVSAGFDPVYVYVAEEAFEMRSLAFKAAPSPQLRQMLGLSATGP